MEKYDVIIIGAGLSGLTCALDLVEKGKKVLLLEAEPVVGGRTSSYIDNGMEVESGFHRYIGFYSAMPKLLKRVGIKLNDIFTWEEKIEIRSKKQGKLANVGLSPFFGPIKVVRGIVGNNHIISPRAKLSLISFFLNGFKDYVANPKNLDSFSVREYASKYGVTEDAFHYVLIPLTSGLFFLPPDRYSAYVFFGLFAPGIPKFYKMRIGAFLGGMTEVMCQPIANVIEKKGGIVETNHKVKKLVLDKSNHVTGVEVSGGHTYKGTHVVVATTLHSAKQLLKPDFKHLQWFQPMFKLPVMPAATLQIDLTKPSISKDITTFGPGTSLASFAEQSRTTFRRSAGRLSIILSNPEKFLTMTPEETLEVVLQDAKYLGMDLTEEVIDYRQINHHYDFHSLEPGCNWLRPEQNTPISGLVLAGDYTMQPHFATMEGAVVSGQKAAKIILEKKNPL